MRYTNITTHEVQLPQGQQELGVAEGQHWHGNVLHSLPQIHGVAALPCSASQHTDCELMWPRNCKGVPVEKFGSLLAGK